MDEKTKATAVTFHAAMTTFGEQPSVVVGSRGGSLVKCNTDAWAAAAAAAGGGGGTKGVGKAGAGKNLKRRVFAGCPGWNANRGYCVGTRNQSGGAHGAFSEMGKTSDLQAEKSRGT